jgi:ATP-binding cassette subfamily C protein LapB
MDIGHFSKRPGLAADLLAMPRLWGSSLELVLASLFLNLLSLALPLVLMQVYDRIVPNDSMSTLAWLVGGFLCALLIESGLRLCRSTITNWSAARFEHQLGTSALRRILDSRIDDFEKLGVGVYLDKFQAVSALRRFYAGQLLQVLMDLPFALLFWGVLYLLGGLVPALFAAGVIAAYLLSATLVRWAYHASRKRQNELGNRLYNYIIECLTGIHTVKALGVEEPMLRRHERLQADTARNNKSLNLRSHLPASLGGLFTQIMLFGVILTAGFEVIGGDITMGALAACSLIGTRLLGPFQRAAGFWVQQANVRIAKSQLHDLANLRTDNDPDAPSMPEDIDGALELEDVAFGYEKDNPVLQGVNLKVEPGEMLGIPASGERGTTTLLSLMAGILPPDEGRVLVDGVDLASVDHTDFTGRISLAWQSGGLFKGTIFDNICMFNPRYREKARDAAQLLGLDEEVSKLPKGYETMVGDKLHEGLPSGVVQRVALARALVVRPRILLLDNVSASMDQASEAVLLWLLDKLKGQMTMVVVTDDARILARCDRVMSLKGGGLVEEPDHGPAPESGKESDERCKAWMRWVMQTARRWSDVSGIVRTIGIEAVDEDHRIFTEYILELNVLIESLSRGKTGIEAVGLEKDIFKKILDYTTVHFQREEGIMKSRKSPGYAYHKVQHDIFSGMVDRFWQDFQAGRIHASDRLKLSILDWWINHINEVDYPTFVLESNFEECPMEAGP